MLDIVINNYTEYIPRNQLQAMMLAEQKQSPKATKNAGKRQKSVQQPPFSLPESMVTPNGVPTAVMSFLEVRFPCNIDTHVDYGPNTLRLIGG